MVHYIRFLRTPQVHLVQKSYLEVSAVVSISTDLGDAYLLHDVELVSRLSFSEDPSTAIVDGTSTWRSGARVVKLALRCPKSVHHRRAVLGVTTKETILAQASNVLPTILDVRSAEFVLENGARSAALVERHLPLSSSVVVKSWEETGDSIARHIWDAALGSLVLFRDLLMQSSPKSSQLSDLKAFLSRKVKGGLNVLELGAGCGIVGLALAQILPNTNVLVTDLDDAQSMLDMNMRSTKLAQACTVRKAVLDWASPFDTKLFDKKIDLVIVADCIYNADSIPLLVQTLGQIFVHSKDCKVFIARKPRHASEMLFFDLIEQAGASLLERATMSLPHLANEADITSPEIEFYVYGQD